MNKKDRFHWRKWLIAAMSRQTINDTVELPDALGGGEIYRANMYEYHIMQNDERIVIKEGYANTIVDHYTGRTRIARDRTIAHLLGEEYIRETAEKLEQVS